MYSRLSTGKINFATKNIYSFWKIIESFSTPHDHFLQHNQNDNTINNRIKRITKIIELLETPEPLVTMIIRGVQSYYLSSSLKLLYQDTDEAKSLHEHQSVIGWENIIRWRISKNFKTYIAHYYNVIRSKRKSDTWANAIISNLLNIHVEAWKDYCETIHESNSKQKQIDQLHEEKIHEISSIKDEANGLTNE